VSHNTWIHRIARVTVVKPLVSSRVTPNQLTTARLATGIAAAAAVGSGVDLWRDVGAAIFVLSVLLDRADGDLARLTGRTSPSGHRYDMIADAVSNALILIGLGVGLRGGEYGSWAVPMGFLAGLAVAAILWMVMRIEEMEGHRAAELPSFAGFDADDAVLLIPLFIWLGQAEGLLLAAVLVAPLVAMLFLGLFRRKLVSQKPE
jgi:phosphatidylglycerophosphate synthase